MSTVFVASKLPMDLELYVCGPQEYFDPSPSGGGVTRTRMVPSGQPIKIRGTGYPILPTPAFQAWKPPPQKVGGYAITANVDGAPWSQWWSQNCNENEPHKSFPPIASGMILWAEDIQKLKKKIRDQEPVMSGYEPLNPNADPRVPRSMSAGVSQLGPTEEMVDRVLPTEE
jgi:hypothetical protein